MDDIRYELARELGPEGRCWSWLMRIEES